jgi:hypothetical protein
MGKTLTAHGSGQSEVIVPSREILPNYYALRVCLFGTTEL